MNPNTMRRIDYWIGIPVCLIFSIIYKIERLLGLRNPKIGEKPKNMLFIELAEMGSTILAYPSIKKARDMFPNSNIYFLLFRQIKDSMEILEVVPKQNVFTIRSSNVFALAYDTLKFICISRKNKIDTTLNLEAFARFSAILGFLSGARKMVGFYRYGQEGLYIGTFLTHKVIYNPHIHTANSFLALVHALNSPLEEVPMAKFSVTNEKLEVPKRHTDRKATEKIWKILKNENPDIDEKKKLVIVNPNASKLISIRKWPLEYYAQMIKKLILDKDVYVAVTGVESEKPDAQFICNAVKDKRVMDLTGKTSLKELLDLYNQGKVLVTNDSGPAHFASLTNIHIFVFFGPETPKLYRPLSDNCTVIYSDYACSPCVSAFNQRLSPCNNNLCLKSITVDSVYKQVREKLN